MSEAQPVSTTIFYYANVAGSKYPAQTVISGSPTEHQDSLGEFFNTLAARVDEDGQELFVTFEPRELGFKPAAAGPGKPLADAPKDVPNCPIHGVPLKEKTNKTTGASFFSCSQRDANGRYCNWKPAEQK